jgi:hypothetical protein
MNSEHRATVARAELPPAARRWLDRALPESHQATQGVELRERGEFLVGERWLPWRGTHLIWQDDIGFEWTARMRVFKVLPLRLRDGCGPADGWGTGKLLGVLRVRRAKGLEVVRSQLVRHLAELPLAPAAAALNPALEWIDEGPDRVAVHARIGDQEATVHLDVDEHGDVVRSHAPDRPRDLPDRTFTDTPFQYSLADHAEVGGVRIPTRLEAAFDYGSGPEPYLRIGVLGSQPVES